MSIQYRKYNLLIKNKPCWSNLTSPPVGPAFSQVSLSAGFGQVLGRNPNGKVLLELRKESVFYQRSCSVGDKMAQKQWQFSKWKERGGDSSWRINLFFSVGWPRCRGWMTMPVRAPHDRFLRLKVIMEGLLHYRDVMVFRCLEWHKCCSGVYLEPLKLLFLPSRVWFW